MSVNYLHLFFYTHFSYSLQIASNFLTYKLTRLTSPPSHHGQETFLLSLNAQNGSRFHPASYSNITALISRGVKLPSRVKVKNAWLCTFIPRRRLQCLDKDNSIFSRRVSKIAKSDYYFRHVCLSVCLPVCLSVCVSNRPSVRPSVWNNSAANETLKIRCQNSKFIKI